MCRHFGEAPAACGSMCDVCKRGQERIASTDVTEAAQGLLGLLSKWPSSEKRATLVQLVNAWRSDKVRRS